MSKGKNWFDTEKGQEYVAAQAALPVHPSERQRRQNRYGHEQQLQQIVLYYPSGVQWVAPNLTAGD